MQQTKLSPRKFPPNKIQWEFDFVTAAYVKLPGETTGRRRFNVFSQEHKKEGDRALLVAQMALRLWEHNFDLYGYDNPGLYRNGTIDIYLCWGGKPGGEQLFDVDAQVPDSVKAAGAVNTIYIYDLNSFADPVEMAREVAHEFGHASLPAIGGFKEPEDWANGFLGEKLYMVRLRDRMAVQKAGPNDTMGATLPQLTDWISKNVDPLAKSGLLYGPSLFTKKSSDDISMNDYLSLCLAQNLILPPKAFGRSLKLVGSSDAKDVPQSFALACAELSTFEFTVPKISGGLPIWFPADKAKFVGAKVLRTERGWAKIQPTAATVKVTMPAL